MDEEIGRIVGIVEERGGLAYTRERAAEYAERAEAALEGLEAGSAVEALRDAVSYAVGRSR